jgi:hypothetical protein
MGCTKKGGFANFSFCVWQKTLMGCNICMAVFLGHVFKIKPRSHKSHLFLTGNGSPNIVISFARGSEV